MSDEREPLSLERVEQILEQMRDKLSRQFGVTVQVDHNGAWGQCGSRYVTLRMGSAIKGDMVEIFMTVNNITDHAVERRAEYEREHPQ